MKQFYNLFEEQKVSAVPTQLTWSHWYEVLSLNDSNEIDYYINKCIKNNLSKRQLRELIRSKEYERLPDDAKNKLVSKEEINIKDLIPNPILIESKDNKFIMEYCSDKRILSREYHLV